MAFLDVSLTPSTSDDFAQKFADDSKWKVLRGVPVFDQHEEDYEVNAPGQDGKPVKQKAVERFGAAELQEIADNCNRLVASGNPPGLTIGHTKDDAKETDQPETIGFGCNYRVQPFGPDQKLGILHDEKYYPERFEEAKTLPYRSVERWRAGKYFKPIALLRREPRRNLGVVAAYQANGDTAVRYSMRYAMPEKVVETEKKEIPVKKPEATAPPADAQPPAPEAAEMEPADKDHNLYSKLLQAHDDEHYAMHCAHAQRYAEEQAGGGELEQPGVGDQPEEYAIGDGSSNQAGQAAMADKKNATHKRSETAKRHSPGWIGRTGPNRQEAGPSGGMGLPSGTNTSTPRLEKERMAANTVDRERYQADLAARDNRIAALERENRIERYAADLRGKRDQGYIFDVAEELTDMQDMNEAQAAKHLKRIEKYEKAPVGERPLRLASGEQPEPKGTPGKINTKEEYEKVLQYQADHPELSIAQVKEKVLGPVRGAA